MHGARQLAILDTSHRQHLRVRKTAFSHVQRRWICSRALLPKAARISGLRRSATTASANSSGPVASSRCVPEIALIPSLATGVVTTALPQAMHSISLFCMPAPICTGLMQTVARAMYSAGSGTSLVTVIARSRISRKFGGSLVFALMAAKFYAGIPSGALQNVTTRKESVAPHIDATRALESTASTRIYITIIQ